jgi:hypothetical protein
MIYQHVADDAPLSQGDIFDDCPALFWSNAAAGAASTDAGTARVRAVVLTQACDLAQSKATRVLLAVVHEVKKLVDRGILKADVIREQIRAHRVFGWYFLPRGAEIDECIVDLRDLHTLPRELLERLIRQGKRLCRIQPPFREHLAQHFSTTYSRIGLPEPYETRPEKAE